MKRKIIISLKIAIIIIIGFLTLGFAKILNNSSVATSSKWLTFDTTNNVWTTTTSKSKYGALSLAKSLYLDPTRLTSLDQNSLKNLLNAKFDFYGDGTGWSYFNDGNSIPSGTSGWNIYYPTAICFDTTASQDDTSTPYKIWQIISMELDTDDGTFITYNYVAGADNQKIEGSDSSSYLAKLGYAVYKATQTSVGSLTSDGYKSVFHYLISAAGKNAGNNTKLNLAEPISQVAASADQTATSILNSISTEIREYANMVKKYKEIEVSKVKNCTSTCYTDDNKVNWTVVGKIQVKFGYIGLKQHAVTIGEDGEYSGNKSSIYWTTDTDFENAEWSNDFSTITSGQKIYIKYKTKKLTTTADSEEIKITFTQKKITYYKSRILVIETCDNKKGQADLTYTAKKQEYYGTDSIYVQAGYSIDITIDKLDADKLEEGVKTGIEGIGFTIYDNTVGKYIVTSSGSKSAGYTSGTGKYASSGTKASKAIVYTDEDGKINITDLSVSYGTHKITVTEVKSKNDYYTVDSSNTETKEITSTGEYSYSFTNEPLEVTISKVDSTTGTALQGIGFKLKLSDGKWVKGNGSGDVSYVSSSSKADEYVTGEDGTVTIVGLKKGTYTVYETSVDSSCNPPYYLEDQKGYDSENGWVVCGTVKVDDSGNITFSVEYENVKRIQLSGTVWEDTIPKDDENDNLMMERRNEGRRGKCIPL